MAATSALTSAPMSVTAPASTQTVRSSAGEPTWLAITPGLRKIPEPITAPATNIVVEKRPNAESNPWLARRTSAWRPLSLMVAGSMRRLASGYQGRWSKAAVRAGRSKLIRIGWSGGPSCWRAPIAREIMAWSANAVLSFGSSRSGDGLQIGAHALVGGRVVEHGGIRVDLPVRAGFAVKVGPPVAMLGQALRAPLGPAHQHARPALVAVLHGGFCVRELSQIPVAADPRVQVLVVPVAILEQSGEGILRGLADLPLETLAVSGHESLLDEIKNSVALDRFKLGVEREGPGEIHHHFAAPVDAQIGKTHFPHHRVAGFVPQLAGHVPIVIPRFIGRLGEDAGHHFGHVDFPQPLVKHHQRLGLRREFGI